MTTAVIVILVIALMVCILIMAFLWYGFATMACYIKDNCTLPTDEELKACANKVIKMRREKRTIRRLFRTK